ncbi:anti-sigma factor family protein [Pseudoduganella aquatica]|uniref:Anti-sigma factor n=1 Tax=Pseudoduganella aquatica TaxID=2660641 RepID=A0A7X4KP74_9BURK|nr:anti-sigma factor [Pseudoduganella aquatica]MYN11079.1 anti-sigma factor [Pseudoduganella aquatica]
MNPVTEAELQAWVDGRLALERRADVDRYLEHHPQELERLRAYRQQNAGLRALYSAVLDEAIPRSMQRPRGWQRYGWPVQRYAASVALMLSSAALGWVAHGSYGAAPDAAVAAAVAANAAAPAAAAPSALAHRAALAHRVYAPEVRHPVEVGADQQEHLVAWLSKRLGAPLRPPRLAPLGYELVGGRLLPGDSGPVAQFMYADASGQRLTLYVSAGQAGNRDSGFRYAQDGAVNVFYWIDGSWGYALSGALAKAELSQVANAVYEQLQP